MKRFFSAILLLTLAGAGHAAPTLEARLDAILHATHAAGAGVAIVRRDTPARLLYFGWADRETNTRVNADTRFRTASAGKMFTALAIARLVEDGKLELDTPLRQLAPEVAFDNPWEGTAPVRIAHLLEHTTGWDDLHFAEYAYDNANEVPLAETLRFHPHSRTSRWIPGTRMAYSNSGSAVAGHVVEKLAGQSFEAFVARSLFHPLGMHSASYFRDAAHDAVGYDATGRNRLPFKHILYRPAGSTSVSVGDMAKFVQMLLDRGKVDGRPLFRASSIERMEAPHAGIGLRAGLPAGDGMGMQELAYRGRRLVGHGGAIDGGHAALWYDPVTGVGFVAMVNSNTPGTLPLFTEAILGTLFGAAAPRNNALAPSAQWDGVDGYYTLANSRSGLAQAFMLFGAVRFAHADQALIRSRLLTGATDRFALDGKFAIDPRTMLPFGVRAQDPLAGDVVVLGSSVYERTPALQVHAALAGMAGLVLASVSSLLWGLAWVPRQLFGKRKPAAQILLRFWPLSASLLVAALIASVPLARVSESSLGRVTPFTVWIMLATGAYGLAALLGALQAWRSRSQDLPARIRLVCYLQAGGHLLAAVYLACHGMLGLRTWA